MPNVSPRQRQVSGIVAGPLAHLNFRTQLLPTKLVPAAQTKTPDAILEE
jgi:hypothetical protein